MRNVKRYLSGEYGLMTGALSKKAAGTRMLTEKERKGLIKFLWLQTLQLLLIGFLSIKKDETINDLEDQVYNSKIREGDLQNDVAKLKAKLRIAETGLKWEQHRADRYMKQLPTPPVDKVRKYLEGGESEVLERQEGIEFSEQTYEDACAMADAYLRSKPYERGEAGRW